MSTPKPTACSELISAGSHEEDTAGLGGGPKGVFSHLKALHIEWGQVSPEGELGSMTGSVREGT